MRLAISPVVLCFSLSLLSLPVVYAAPPVPIWEETGTLTGLPDCATVGEGGTNALLSISNACGDPLSLSTVEGECDYLCSLGWTCAAALDGCADSGASPSHPLSAGTGGIEICDGCDVSLTSMEADSLSAEVDLQWSIGDGGDTGFASLTLLNEVVDFEEGCDGGIPTSELDPDGDEADAGSMGEADAGSTGANEGAGDGSEGPGQGSGDANGAGGCHQAPSAGGALSLIVALFLAWPCLLRRRSEAIG